MTTVRELIKHLQEIDNPDQAIIYQYYLAEHFEADTEIFENVAKIFNSCLPNNAYDEISSEIEMVKRIRSAHFQTEL